MTAVRFPLPLCLWVATLCFVGCRNRAKQSDSLSVSRVEQSNPHLADTVAATMSEMQNAADEAVPGEAVSPVSVGEWLGGEEHLRLDTIRLAIASNESSWLDTLHYMIPKVVGAAPQYSSVAQAINQRIEELLEYRPDSATPIDMDGCLGIDFQYEYQSHYLYVSYKIVNYGAHGEVENCESQLFDTETGEYVEQHNIPFSALFSVKGYFEFLASRNWSDGVRKAFEQEYRRMNQEDEHPVDEKRLQEEIEENCNFAKFHIAYSFDREEFRFSREMSYYAVMAWANRCYEPEYGDQVSLRDLQPYLNDVGKQLIDDNYFMLSPINQILLKNRLWSQIEDYMFFELNDADNTCIALNCQDRQNVWGYWYRKGRSEIELKGVCDEDVLTLKTTDSILTINVKAFKDYPYSREQIVGYSDKSLPY